MPAATPQPVQHPWFVDATAECGVDFVHDPGPAPPSTGTYFMPQILGSGVALADFDADGRLDIYLLQNVGPTSAATNRLYLQDKTGHFRDATPGTGLDVHGYTMGVAVGDVNNDGRVDLLITQYGSCRLLVNRGGTFADATVEAGLGSPLWGMSAAMFDYDRDGWLDLVIVDYVRYDPARRCGPASGEMEYCAPNEFEGTVTRLLHNLGGRVGNENSPDDSVHYDEVTLASGLGRVPGPGLGVLTADFNADHWPDIFVANDGQPNRLWINQHDGTFCDEAVLRGVAYNSQGVAEANMGVAWGDVDGNGACDLLVTHLTEETNTLWKQNPPGIFDDRTVASGLTHSAWRGTGFGTVLADFDQDGALDLAVVNGRIARSHNAVGAADSFWDQYRERNQLFANDGQGRFRDVSAENAPFSKPSGISRGLACGDLNNDGALDLVTTDVDGRARIFLNAAANRGHWLLIRAFDPALQRDAYGSEVAVVAGPRRWVGLCHPAGSYLSSHDPRAHFGLGLCADFDRIDVVWPDGTMEIFPGGAADRVLTLNKGQGQPADVR